MRYYLFSDRIYPKCHNGVTEFLISALKLERWMHQNNATVIDGFDGCLIDNLLVCTKNGFAAIYEHYLNAWESDYRIVFSRHGDRVSDNFYAALENYYKDYED